MQSKNAPTIPKGKQTSQLVFQLLFTSTIINENQTKYSPVGEKINSSNFPFNGIDPLATICLCVASLFTSSLVWISVLHFWCLSVLQCSGYIFPGVTDLLHSSPIPQHELARQQSSIRLMFCFCPCSVFLCLVWPLARQIFFFSSM